MYEPHLTGINSPPCILFRWSVWWDRYACGDDGAGRASGYRLVFAARLFIHFLAASPNRSTSCLLSMMLSSTQEITCLCFSHQSPLPAAVCPSSPVCFCILNFSSRCTLFPHQLLMTTLPSVSYRRFFYIFFAPRPPTVHFFPTSFDPITARLSSMKTRRFKSGVAMSQDATRVMTGKTFYACVCLKWL